jgi:colicin import membrane protein
MVIKISIFDRPEINFSEAIRVDMVDLPEKNNQMPEKIVEPNPEPLTKPPTQTKTPPPPAPHEIVKKKIPLNEPEINLNNKHKQKAALDKLKKLAAIEKIQQQVNEQKAKSEPHPQPSSQRIFKGRVLSKGSALSGLDRLQSENYLAQLDSLIKSHWQLPQWLINKPLKTKVLVKFSPDGNLIEKKIFQSSGNPTYDDYCLRSIENSAPFPKVPEKFTAIYSEDGVLIGFPE